MPERRAVVQLGLLLLALPTQYLVSRLYSTSAGERSTALKEFMTVAAGFQAKYLSWRSWQDWCLEILDDVQVRYSNHPFVQSYNPRGETPAVEVFLYKQPKGHFTRSALVRSPRPDTVQYRIGQVVRHKVHGYRGVVIGWDSKPQAPTKWLESFHNEVDLKQLQSLPFYAILIHSRDIPKSQIVYVAQKYITPVYRFQISNTEVDSTGKEWGVIGLPVQCRLCSRLVVVPTPET